MKYLITCSPKRSRIYAQTARSISDIQTKLREDGHQCRFFVMPFPELGEMRNFLATQFHDSVADVMVGIDNGVVVSLDAFNAMTEADVDYVAARIPHRMAGLNTFAEAVRSGLSNSEATRRAIGADTGAKATIEEVKAVNAGFFVLRRQVLEEIINLNLATKRAMRVPRTTVNRYNFYNHIEEDGERLTEDHSFCSRVRKAGFKVMAYSGPGVGVVCDLSFGS